jgi:putative Ca2+/H+ antiporter (TMEM165/GDT1 family)
VTAGFLTYFGIKTLMESSSKNAAGEEEEAKETMKSRYENSKGSRPMFLNAFLMVFMAEWGDRSMLATVALGASMNPLTVALGATSGHALACLIAVQGGGLMSKHLDERKVSQFSGSLFLLFAITTLLRVF